MGGGVGRGVGVWMFSGGGGEEEEVVLKKTVPLSSIGE